VSARVVLVAAVARNGVIGAHNALLWRLPTDLKRFRARTLGKPLIVGRKTFQSIGRALPGRAMIVVTHDVGFAVEGVRRARDVEDALRLGREVARAMGAEEICVGGGGEIYAQTIARADGLALTEVDLEVAGEALFPPIDRTLWRETSREPGVRGERDEAEFTFVEYKRT
jgi:dihydrofolate reductase